VLEYVYAAGAGGFLVGRTIWVDAVRNHFPGLAAVSAALKKDSVAILNSLSRLTKERPHSWQPSFRNSITCSARTISLVPINRLSKSCPRNQTSIAISVNGPALCGLFHMLQRLPARYHPLRRKPV
jgi:hypothetical protein